MRITQENGGGLMHHRDYRPDIDGIRAIAVLAVIFFHSGIKQFSGGFIGVDIFFVISGFLITNVVYDEIKTGKFSFRNFYKRRIARLLPAAIITLVFVLLYCSVFFSPERYASVGKDILFSALGLENFYLASGVDYFAVAGELNPLIHFWSLGVEEQFYLFWPLILVVTVRKGLKFSIGISIFIFTVSLISSILSISNNSIGSYYLLQHRAFELQLGCIASLVNRTALPLKITDRLATCISSISIGLIFVPLFVYDKTTDFPGLNALLPCIGAMLLLLYPDKRFISKLYSNRLFVFIGVISYPLYLYHQPMIVVLDELSLVRPYTILLSILTICTPLAYLTYKYIEKPIRSSASRSQNHKSKTLILGLLLLVLAVAGLGIVVNRFDGFPKRMKFLNPYATEFMHAQARSFHQHFKIGFQISETNIDSRVLFIGDSTMQQYVVPMLKATKIPFDDVDTVTRGGCVMLKNVEYIEGKRAQACNGVRDKLYASNNRHWDTIVISQNWRTTGDHIKNFPANLDELERWTPFIEDTVLHLRNYADRIIIIGDHPTAKGTEGYSANISIEKQDYISNLQKITVNNYHGLVNSKKYFRDIAEKNSMLLINPVDIICSKSCITHNNEWSYFRDSLHFSSAATEFLSLRMEVLIKDFQN